MATTPVLREATSSPSTDISQAGEGARTPDLRFTKPSLYQLSYSGASAKGRAAGRPLDHSRVCVRTRRANPVP